MGDIVGAHALAGVLRVRAYQPPAPSLAPGRTVFLERAGGRRAHRIVSAGAHGRGLVLLGLEDVVDRTAAEALVGARVLVRVQDLPAAGADEFYYHELVGFRMETAAGDPLGTIAATFTTGLNDVWVVQGGPREYLVPAIADVVRTIDREGGRVVIEPLPGLLD